MTLKPEEEIWKWLKNAKKKILKVSKILKILEALERIHNCKAECQQMIMQKAKKPEENFQERLAKKKKKRQK